MIFSLQSAEYQDAETHFKQALHLYRKVEASRGTLHGAAARAAAGKLADKAAPEGLYGVIIDLGQLYGCMRKDYDELQVYQEALDEVRVNIAHASSPQLQGHLSNGLAAMGQMYIRQYYSQITNGAKEDKGKCTVAIALCEEALSIQRALSQDGITADTLTTLASAHGCLEMFDGARSALKEALNLSSCCDGEESTRVASFHHKMASICYEQVNAIRAQLGMHMEYMSTNSMVLYHSRGSRVLVAGLQKNQQYNGIEGVVMKTNAPRLRVRLHAFDNKEIMLKPENVCPLFPTAPKLQEQLLKLHDLAQERIASSKEDHRIQIKVTGVKHVNAAIACQNLGTAYLETYRLAETGLAVSLLMQADKIRRRVIDGDKDMALSMSQNLSAAKAAQARFDEAGVLSAMPCCWPPTSRREDETHMAQLFFGLQARNGKRGSPSMSSEAMQQGLRLFGLFNVTVSACGAVGGP
jgi:tetratricopeptide (TPR) repeat protein